MISEALSYTSAFIVGLLGGAHCIGMCGGIMNALSFAIPNQHHSRIQIISILSLYNFGRIISYSIAGALVGFVGEYLQQTGSQMGPTLRIVAGLMLIAMGLYLAGWWHGLTYLEKLGGYLWKYLQPIGKRLMPVAKPSQALFLGFVWGWLPCGLVYSALTWSVTAAHWQQSALIMFCFGLGTLPAMMLTGVFSHQVKTWIQKTSVRNIAALFIIGFGVWTIGWVVMHRGSSHDTSHQHATSAALSKQSLQKTVLLGPHFYNTLVKFSTQGT